MKAKCFLIGLFVLVLGMVIIGCDTGTGGTSGSGEPTGFAGRWLESSDSAVPGSIWTFSENIMTFQNASGYYSDRSTWFTMPPDLLIATSTHAVAGGVSTLAELLENHARVTPFEREIVYEFISNSVLRIIVHGTPRYLTRQL